MALLSNDAQDLFNLDANANAEKTVSINNELENLQVSTPDHNGSAQEIITKLREYCGILTKILKFVKIFTGKRKDVVIDKILDVVAYIQNPDSASASSELDAKITQFSSHWDTIRDILEFIKKFTGDKADAKIDIIIALGDALSKHSD